MPVAKQIFTSEEMVGLSTSPLLKLQAVTDLFEALHENDIVYCNLKGNDQHLRIFMAGESDIDILFDQNQKEKLESILSTLGFKKFEAIKQKQYKDIVDFIALDPGSGKVIHLHTYYRLTIGRPFLKGYQLDIENQILSTRVYDEAFGMYCMQPAFELILLYLTESLKLRHRDLIIMHLKNKTSFSEKTIYEHSWLRRKTSPAEMEAVLKSLFKDHIPIYNLIKGEFNRKQLHKLAPLIRKELARYRLYSLLGGTLLRWYRETTVTVFRKLSHILARPVLSMRINPRGGIMVAVTGSDSAVNSTVANQLKETFGKKLDVYKINFGKDADGNSMKSQSSNFIEENHNGKARQMQTPVGRDGFLLSVRNGIGALMLARKKSKYLKMGLAAKKKGALVICDYFPQSQVMGYNDGPVLHDLLRSKNPFLRSLARMESKIYTESKNDSPDLVFRLVANNEGAGKVSPGEILGENTDRGITAGTKQPAFNSKCKTVTVDAGKPLTEVLYIIKNEIWDML